VEELLENVDKYEKKYFITMMGIGAWNVSFMEQAPHEERNKF